jgi:phosphomannomutase
MGRLFGTDGVRGVYGRDLTDELAFGLGRAAVTVLARYEPKRRTLVIGRDTRASGEPLEHALAEGIREAGADVILAGVQPTPAVAFLTTDVEAAAGVVISASHNPFEDNGIKFFRPVRRSRTTSRTRSRPRCGAVRAGPPGPAAWCRCPMVCVTIWTTSPRPPRHAWTG